MNVRMQKEKRKIIPLKFKIMAVVFAASTAFNGCGSQAEDAAKPAAYQENMEEAAVESGSADVRTEEAVSDVNAADARSDVSVPDSESAEAMGVETARFPQAENPDDTEDSQQSGSSFGLGSAAFLKGRNLLVSLFVTTPESTWTEEEQQKSLEKLGIAAAYIEAQAEQYQTDTEIIFDWNSQQDLKTEAKVDFPISEEYDYMDRLDEEIALWVEKQISFDGLLAEYDAEGIAVCIFVNNPGISYAIVFDGTDNEKESLVLFTKDYYNKGQEETAAAYAHEILHVFGAYDLYEGADFTEEVTDYVQKTYPTEIMLTVSAGTDGQIRQTISPITAYHLGWLTNPEETNQFPELINH